MFGSKIGKLSVDILKGINTTVWGGVSEAEKVGKIVKTGVSVTDSVVGVSHAVEDFGCNDYICGTIDVIGTVSTMVGGILGNIPSTKHLTMITGSITVSCRSIRYYCKNHGGLFWECTVAAGQGVKKAVQFVVKK